MLSLRILAVNVEAQFENFLARPPFHQHSAAGDRVRLERCQLHRRGILNRRKRGREIVSRVWIAVVAPTVAVFAASDDVLIVSAVVLIVMITRPPTLNDPKLQLTVPPLCVQVPCVVDTETKFTALGNGSDTPTPCATAGPLFVTCSV